ncbi:MAG TPA: ABC-2 type transporter [Anaerolineae bacterium]|nr:ABC-2 type transporter [Anaerolineae bacterium]
MLGDILTVMWKEAKGLLRHQGSRGKTMLGLLVPVVMLGVYLPLQIGRALVEGPWSLLISVFIPMMMVGMTIPESFAGERERHTLGTLLASRLPDRAILIGKVAVAVGYAWGMTLLLLLLSMAMVNVTHWDGQVLLYSPTMALANGAFSLLLANLVAWLGVLISLRAATVQQAQQTLMTATLFPVVLLQMIPLLLLNVVPDGRDYLRELVAAADPQQVMLIVMAVLVVLDLALLVAAMARFKRARLVVP